jgi:4-hydroxythreonine-4-phosphate dehydrogenase
MKLSGEYKDFTIIPSAVTKESGRFSYDSFLHAIELAKDCKVDGICTLPIHKKAWELADIKYVGHTDMLRDIFNMDAIMMLGCEEMYVALFSEHIPLKNVPSQITYTKLCKFLEDFFNCEIQDKTQKVAVLGLNPHAGDDGVLGDEENIIRGAIKDINKKIGGEVFVGPMVPDTIFTPFQRKNYKYFIAMYHDQGLAPLKALYFDEGINVSLNLPIKRTSVDHGTAFDIAYKKNRELNSLSYMNSIKKLLY